MKTHKIFGENLKKNDRRETIVHIFFLIDNKQ